MGTKCTPDDPDLIRQLSDANIMEAFPQEIRDKVKASRLQYFALFEEFKNSLLVIPYFDEVFSHNNEYFYTYVAEKNSSRIQALDPTKKEVMTRIIEDIFSMRNMFIDGSTPDFFKVQTSNGVRVDNTDNTEGADTEDNAKDKNNNKDDELKDNDEKDEAENEPEGPSANVKRKHPKKKKGAKKRSKRGGGGGKSKDGDENKEKWTGKKEVQPFKKKIIKINGKFITWPFPPADVEKLHIDYGANREHMNKVCERMEGFCSAILDILETDFYKSRDHVFRGLADIFGRLAEPFDVSNNDFAKLKAIVEMVSSITSPKEDYSSYGAANAQCEAHRKAEAEQEEGVVIKDVTGLDPEAIESAPTEVRSSDSGEESDDDEETSCTCPCHGPCPCCCSGCYLLNHQDLIDQNDGNIVKIVKKGLGILPEKPKEPVQVTNNFDEDGILTGPRIEEIEDDDDDNKNEDVNKAIDEKKRKQKKTLNLRGTRNTKFQEGSATVDYSLKKALDDNIETTSSESNSMNGDGVTENNLKNGDSIEQSADIDVPASSVEDANGNIEQSDESRSLATPTNDLLSKHKFEDQEKEPTDKSPSSPTKETVGNCNSSSNNNMSESSKLENDPGQPPGVQKKEKGTLCNDDVDINHHTLKSVAENVKIGKKNNKSEKEDLDQEQQSTNSNSQPKKKKKKNSKKTDASTVFDSSDKCSHCCCHCGCNRHFHIEMPDINDPEAFALSFLEELKRFSPANRNHVFDMSTMIAAEQSRNTLKQKVVEIGMKYFLTSLKELKVSFHLYIIELVFKIIMSTSYARKYCFRDNDFFPALSRFLAVLDPCKNRDKDQLRGDAAHVLYVSLMGAPREAFEKVSRTDAFSNLVSILQEEPNNHNDAQSAEDVFMCFMLFTDEWDLFIVNFKTCPINRLIKHWRRYALEYTSHLPNFIWTLETLKKRLTVLFEAYRHLRFDIRLPKTFSVEKLEKHYETACSNPKCFKVNFTEFQSKYKKCSRCHLAYYCSKECQLSHWKRHKKWCEKPDWLIEEEREAEIDKALKNIDFTSKSPQESETVQLEQDVST